MRNTVLYYVLRIAQVVLPRVPLRVAYFLASVAGRFAYCVLSGPRTGITSNVSRVLQLSPDNTEVKECARRVFVNDAKNWIDTLRISRLSGDQILCLVDVDGWDNLTEATQWGTGVVLAAMHLGNFDLVGQVLAVKGYRVTIPVESMQPPELFQFLLHLRTSKGIDAVPLHRAARAMVKALKQGDIVAIAGDRILAGRGIETEFFGQNIQFPRAALALAHRLRAPLVVGFGVRTPSDRFRAIITPPLPLRYSEDQDRDLEYNARLLSEVMEKYIREFPDQWLAFSPLWPEGTGTKSLATIGSASGGGPARS